MQKLKSLLGRLLPLPEDELDGVVKYVMSIKSTDEQVEYLETLLGQEHVGDIISALAPADADIPKSSNQKKSAISKSPPKKKETSSGGKGKGVVCDCQAREHELLANCLECGRILCVRESFPCPFCGNDPQGDGNIDDSAVSGKKKKKFVKFDPQSVKKQSVLTAADSESKASSNVDTDSKLDSANRQLEKLLKFDREDAVRTRVHDLSEDYASVETNVWLSPAERALALKQQMEYERKLEEERRKVRINIDLHSLKLSEAERELPDAPDFSEMTTGNRKSKPENNDYVVPKVYVQEGPVRYIPSQEALEEFSKSRNTDLQKPSIIQNQDEDLLSLLI